MDATTILVSFVCSDDTLRKGENIQRFANKVDRVEAEVFSYNLIVEIVQADKQTNTRTPCQYKTELSGQIDRKITRGDYIIIEGNN